MLLVYILHFDQPVDNRRHYVGITTAERYRARMLEHRNNAGAVLTRKACEALTPWSVGAVIATLDAQLERRLINTPDLDLPCVVCAGRPPLRRYTPERKAPGPSTWALEF